MSPAVENMQKGTRTRVNPRVGRLSQREKLVHTIADDTLRPRARRSGLVTSGAPGPGHHPA